MKIVGIIGPYFSHGDRRMIDINIANARLVMRTIADHFGESKLIGFFCPHSHTSKFEREANAPETYYHTMDAEIYSKACDGFVVLPTWETSSGSKRDVELVQAVLRKKIVFLPAYGTMDLKLMLGELEQWAKE